MAVAKTVDEYIERNDAQWGDALRKLRKALTDIKDLDETIKWGAPAYTLEGKNLVGIGAFKSYVGLWFHQGALLSDPDQVLINAQAEKTKAMRQWRFDSAKDIKIGRVKAYAKEAIKLQRAGKEIKPVRTKPLTIPLELKAALAKNKKARQAFDAMTKGKQREYADHIADAKRDETKQKRLKKIIPMIAAGKGLYDKYKNC